MSTFPYINPAVRYLGTAKLRMMNSRVLKALSAPIVFKEPDGTELAVLIPWRQFLELQQAASASKETKP